MKSYEYQEAALACWNLRPSLLLAEKKNRLSVGWLTVEESALFDLHFSKRSRQGLWQNRPTLEPFTSPRLSLPLRHAHFPSPIHTYTLSLSHTHTHLWVYAGNAYKHVRQHTSTRKGKKIPTQMYTQTEIRVSSGEITIMIVSTCNLCSPYTQIQIYLNALYKPIVSTCFCAN